VLADDIDPGIQEREHVMNPAMYMMGEEEARKDVFKYMAVFYNVRSCRVSLGYIRPVTYEEMRSDTTVQAACKPIKNSPPFVQYLR
jgi:hypothetical protein